MKSKDQSGSEDALNVDDRECPNLCVVVTLFVRYSIFCTHDAALSLLAQVVLINRIITSTTSAYKSNLNFTILILILKNIEILISTDFCSYFAHVPVSQLRPRSTCVSGWISAREWEWL